VARGILRAVRDAVGDRIAILGKLNLSDGVRGGITVEEATRTAVWIEADGTVDALEMTAGSSLLNPMYLFRGGAPVRELVEVMPQPIRSAMRLTGRHFIREYPYRDAYLLDDARAVRAAVSLPMVLLGGITDRASMDLAMAEGFEFVAMARALLREPDLVARIAADASTPSLCIHCNRCMPTNFVGTHCPVVEVGSSRSASWGTPAGYAGTGH
jgi:2,4-dienoyl-CoA reductase-like NADH-dependent reductase (Old Yellow Enzyme family)